MADDEKTGAIRVPNRQLVMRQIWRDPEPIFDADFRVLKATINPADQKQLQLVIADVYGQFKGVYHPPRARAVPQLEGQVLRVWGWAMDYDRPEDGLIVSMIEPPEDPAAASFMTIPTSTLPKVSATAARGFVELVESLSHEPVARLLRTVLGDDRIWLHFFRAKASGEAHHAYEGGLAVHSLECAQLVAGLPAAMFSNALSRELAIAAAALHDIGKIEWVRSGYCNPMISHETRNLSILAEPIDQLRRELDVGAADLLTYLVSRESRCEHACSPEAVAVALADRLSATKEASSIAFASVPKGYRTAERCMGGQRKRYVRAVECAAARR